jgi:DNA-binding NtrC family response regulator
MTDNEGVRERVPLLPIELRRPAIIAAHDETKLIAILGGPGSGKGNFARWIHQHSPRAGKIFIEWDAKRHPASQLQDIWIACQGGTLAIQQIECLTEPQKDFIIQTFKHRSLTSADASVRLINVRLVLTSSAESFENWMSSHLRPHQYQFFRMPNLSERLQDFENIVELLLSEITFDTKLGHIQGISSDAMAFLKQQTWNGNIRELRESLYNASQLCRSNKIQLSDIK